MQEAANSAFCALGRADVASAQSVFTSGALHGVKAQLTSSSTDTAVQKAGLGVVTALAESSANLASGMLDDELLHKIVAVLRTHDAPVSLLERAAQSITAHVVHSAALAHRFLDAGAADALVGVLASATSASATKRLQAAVLQCLSFCADHDAAGAARVIAAGAVAPALDHVMDDSHAAVRRAASSLLQRLATRTPTLAEHVASDGCITGLLQALKLDRGTHFAFAPLTALGHIAAFSVQFAQAVRPSLNAFTEVTLQCFNDQAIVGGAQLPLQRVVHKYACQMHI